MKPKKWTWIEWKTWRNIYNDKSTK